MLLIDTTAQPEHSQCHLVETYSTTSLLISLYITMSTLTLTSKSTKKPSAQPMAIEVLPTALIMVDHHAMPLLTLLKVK